MFKNLAVLILTILLLSNQGISQETKKTLSDKALLLYQQGKFEKAAETAEKVVEMEKQSQPQDTTSYVNSVLNAARIKQAYIIQLQNKLSSKTVNGSERLQIYNKNSQTASEIEMLLRLALSLNETNGKAATTQTADIKNELATFIQKFNPTAKPSVQSSRERIDEAEKLLAESLVINEQVNGKEDDKTLAVVLQSGEFYQRYVNFEKSLPFYERYLQAVEKKGIKNYPDAPIAIHSYASILYAVYQEQESNELIKKLVELTPKSEPIKLDEFNFQLRSKDAIAYNSKIIQSFAGEDLIYKQKFELQSTILQGSRIELPPKLVRVTVKVVVDENGKVIEAKASEKDSKLRARAEQEVLNWFVRPFIYNNVKRKLRGTLTYAEAQNTN